MHYGTLEHSGDLVTRFFRHDDAKATVLETRDIELSTDNFLKELQVFTVEKIKPVIGPLAV
jgi:hypothetical protein